LEGITVKDKRLMQIMQNNVQPANRSEGEIAGYRDVLATIHSSYDAIPIKPSIFLQFHRDMYKFSSVEGGTWKIKRRNAVILGINPILPTAYKSPIQIRNQQVAGSNPAIGSS